MNDVPALYLADQLPVPADNPVFSAIADGLESQGWVILPDALPDAVTENLLLGFGSAEDNAFQPAAIGRQDDTSHNPFVRRDRIVWLEPGMPAAQNWLSWVEDLKQALNRQLFMGLFSFESHLSYYPPGAFYRKHLDAFRGQTNRVVSVVAYLNRGWEPGQGGELVIYAGEDQETEVLRVTPAFGTVVVLLSEEVPHEVLPATRDRYSVAGWFRVNGSHHDRVDPPR